MQLPVYWVVILLWPGARVEWLHWLSKRERERQVFFSFHLLSLSVSSSGLMMSRCLASYRTPIRASGSIVSLPVLVRESERGKLVPSLSLSFTCLNLLRAHFDWTAHWRESQHWRSYIASLVPHHDAVDDDDHFFSYFSLSYIFRSFLYLLHAYLSQSPLITTKQVVRGEYLREGWRGREREK